MVSDSNRSWSRDPTAPGEGVAVALRRIANDLPRRIDAKGVGAGSPVDSPEIRDGAVLPEEPMVTAA